MEVFSFRNVSFTYPEQENKVLRDISFGISQGEFVIICGPSGCGKSTLLRHLKTCLSPHGRREGEIFYKGMPLQEADERTQIREIGFVMQSPENQIVTDKVWHELAFGLESLGLDTPVIRRRVAETAAFFGIEDWFHKNVSELSGGQKQLLNLACVVCMNPQVLVLDEPTAQLDPVAGAEFLSLLGKINRELGITVIITEHRLEDAFPFASRVIVMEQGRIICDDSPENTGHKLREKGSGMFLTMPVAMRVWAGIETALPCPVTVRDGSLFLTERNKEKPVLPLDKELRQENTGDAVIDCEELWFRYERNEPDVVKGFSFTLHRGEFYALLGGNGAGKTTALKLIAGFRKPYRGTVKINGRVALLPQNPQALFVKHTVRDDLFEALSPDKKFSDSAKEQVSHVVALCGLSDILDRHPYDISGGEQQRAALAKLLLTSPDILLLDEPTKGFDAGFKEAFAQIIKKLTNQGVSVLMVSHDIAFCAEYAQRCGMFFDGNVTAEGTPREFFSGNSFYTTAANRMARHIIPEAVTADDIIACCGGKIEKTAVKQINEEKLSLPEASPKVELYSLKPLKLWRKILATVSALAAFVVFLYATGISDLSALTQATGISFGGNEQLFLYGALFISLTVFLFATGRRRIPTSAIHVPSAKRKLSKRTIVAASVVILLIPVTIFTGIFYLDNNHYGLVAILVLIECMLPFALVFEGRRPKARELVVIAVLCAIGVAGRSLFFMLPQFKPVLALAIIAGIALGSETGFLVGALTMLLSNMLFSQGPWTPWQMFAAGITGFIAGILFRKGFLSGRRIPLAVFGAVATVVIYGGIMNPAAAFTFASQSISLKSLAAYYASGLPMDIVHGFSTALFIMFGAEPLLEKLDRIKVKYGFAE